MPIPFLEALWGRLAPVFKGTVPLERERRRLSQAGPGWPVRGLTAQQAQTQDMYSFLGFFGIYMAFLKQQHTEGGFKVELCILNLVLVVSNEREQVGNLREQKNQTLTNTSCIVSEFL